MHSPDHASPACSCPCAECQARSDHHPQDHSPQLAAALVTSGHLEALQLAAERDPITPQLARELAHVQLEEHPSAQLVGGLIPAHVPGAYPQLECCGGLLELVTEAEARAAWGDR